MENQMRKIFTIFLLGIAFYSISAKTNLSGNISADSTLTLAGSPYIVTSNVTINHAVTLTVDSAVVILFTNNTNLYVSGTINARYTTFTSAADTIGGIAHSGDWGNIQVGDYYNAGSVILDTCNVKYAGNSNSTSLYLSNGSLTLYSVFISNSSHDGIGASAGVISLNNVNISNCSGNGITFNQGVSVSIINSSIQSCTWPIVYNGTASLVFNGINTFSGNKYNGILMNFGGTSTSLVLDTINIPYVFGDFYVNSGTTLTIATSDVLKFNGGHLYINGSFNAVATLGQKIYFTSFKNDNLFGDTNGDGSNTGPATNDWGGIIFNDVSIDSACIMKRCDISFSGSGNFGGVTMINASPTIDSCNISNSYYGAMVQGLSNPIFVSDTVGSSQMVPFALSFEANPVFSNNTFSFSDNQYDAIGLLGGTLLGNAILPIRSVTSVSNVTYLMLNSVTIPSGLTLTINKGIVIKAINNYQRFIVQGKLVAVGSADSAIVFTSAKDDNFGHPGDTNKDGTQTVPAIGDWGGITFETGSDSNSVLDHCIIQYGYQPTSYYYNGTYLYGGEITTINASPTISNCSIKDMAYGIYAFSSSHPLILNDSLVNSTSTPIAMSVASNPTFTNDIFINNQIIALGIIGENVPLNGEIRERNVAGYNNITYVLLSDLTINSGADVTVDPGVVIKSGGPGIYVNGGFRAKGTKAGGNVVFTSLKDDNFGNPFDTNHDGNSTSPAAGDWSTIRFLPTSDDVFSLLDSCLIKFGGNGNWGGVTYSGAGSTISNSTISDSYNYGIRCEGSSTPNVVNVVLQNGRLDPIAMSLTSNPTFTNITFAANGSKGVRIIEGVLSSNASLNQRSIAGIPNIAYIIDQLTISPNAVLTIEPGVVIKFASYYDDINVQGAMVADGTATQKVVFTSLKDDSNGGDTNNDGNNSAPSKGDWDAIIFNPTNLDSLNLLKNCIFRYGGSDAYGSIWGAIRVYNTTVKVDSCTVELSNSSAFGISGSSNPVISNCMLDNISQTPVTMSMFANPSFSNNTVLNVGIMALGIIPENYSVNDTIPIRNFGGYNNITYYLLGACTINSGTTITIPAGLVFKGGNFVVNGAIAVQGTPTQKVVFTDIRDDSYGHPNDTNQDGTSTTPSIQGGSRISFADVSIDSLSIIKNALIRYMDAGIYLTQASPRITNTIFDNDNWGIYLTGVSNPSIDSCLFNNLTYTPIRISLVSYPSSTVADSISGTTYKAIGVIDYETLVQDVTLTKKSFAGINNIPYLFAHYTVANNSILTLSPGLIIKFFPGCGLDINKGLMAIGGSSPDSTIVLTDLRDDYYGGDSNADSNASNPYNYYPGWNGITFEGQSLPTDCNLSYCVIRYAGIGNSGSAITTNNASPTITHTLLSNDYNGLTANGTSNPIINFSDIYQDQNLGVNNVNKSFVINATNNWWGDNSGPKNATLNPAGTGQAVSDGVNFNPWLGSGASNPIMGDVSLNGLVQAYDASLILKYVVNPHGTDSLNAIQQKVADVSGNGTITAYDASLILQYSVGLITFFPAELSPSNAQPANIKTNQYLALQKVSGVKLDVLGGTANYGDKLTVPIKLSNASGIVSLQINLKYLPSMMSFNNASLGTGYSGYSLNYYADQKTGNLDIAFAGTKPMVNDGTVLILTFDISKDLKGIVNTNLDVTKFLGNETDFSSSVSSASIELFGKPTAYQLYQNYPNPFNPSTIISFEVPNDNSPVNLIIYNIQGQEVKTLINSIRNAGRYSIKWDGTDNHGEKVSSGIYFCRLLSNKFVGIKKMILLK